MSISKNEISKKITDYQLKIVIILRMGYRIGIGQLADKSFNFWLEKNDKYTEMSFRTDSVSKILDYGLMEVDEILSKQSTMYYRKTDKIDEILSSINEKRIQKLKQEVINKLKSVA